MKATVTALAGGAARKLLRKFPRDDVPAKQFVDGLGDCYVNLAALGGGSRVDAPKDGVAVLLFKNVGPAPTRGYVRERGD